MENYNRIRLSMRSLSSDQLSAFCQTTLKLTLPLLADFSADERLSDGLKELDKHISQFDSADKTPKTSDQPSLGDLDKLQDRDFSDLKAYLKLQLRHRQANRRQAAETLYLYLVSLGDITRLPHSQQTVAMEKAFKTLDSKDYRALLVTTQASDYYANLKDSHTKFEAAYLAKVNTANQQTKITRTDRRKVIEDDYNNLYAYLLSLEYFGKDSYHRPFLAAFNNVRQTFLQQVRKKAEQGK